MKNPTTPRTKIRLPIRRNIPEMTWKVFTTCLKISLHSFVSLKLLEGTITTWNRFRPLFLWCHNIKKMLFLNCKQKVSDVVVNKVSKVRIQKICRISFVEKRKIKFRRKVFTCLIVASKVYLSCIFSPCISIPGYEFPISGFLSPADDR